MDPENQEIAEAVGEHVEAVVENATADIQAQLDHAEARADNAEAAAEQIADAAMASEFGRQLDAIRGELEQCRTDLAGAHAEARTARERVELMQAELTALQASIPPPSIPQASPEPATVEIPVTEEAAEILEEVTDPVTAEESAGDPPVPAVEVVPVRRRRWI